MLKDSNRVEGWVLRFRGLWVQGGKALGYYTDLRPLFLRDYNNQRLKGLADEGEFQILKRIKFKFNPFSSGGRVRPTWRLKFEFNSMFGTRGLSRKA